MRIGIAGEMHDWPAAARLGYEYFEANLSAVASLSEREFSERKKTAGRDRDTGGGV